MYSEIPYKTVSDLMELIFGSATGMKLDVQGFLLPDFQADLDLEYVSWSHGIHIHPSSQQISHFNFESYFIIILISSTAFHYWFFNCIVNDFLQDFSFDKGDMGSTTLLQN